MKGGMIYSLICCLELTEETYVVLAEQSQVAYLVFQVGNTLDTHTEGIASIDLAVDAASLKHVRINHAATQNLYPACMLAEAASLTTADVATDVHFSTWLGDGAVRGAQTKFG